MVSYIFQKLSMTMYMVQQRFWLTHRVWNITLKNTAFFIEQLPFGLNKRIDFHISPLWLANATLLKSLLFLKYEARIAKYMHLFLVIAKIQMVFTVNQVLWRKFTAINGMKQRAIAVIVKLYRLKNSQVPNVKQTWSAYRTTYAYTELCITIPNVNYCNGIQTSDL